MVVGDSATGVYQGYYAAGSYSLSVLSVAGVDIRQRPQQPPAVPDQRIRHARAAESRRGAWYLSRLERAGADGLRGNWAAGSRSSTTKPTC